MSSTHLILTIEGDDAVATLVRTRGSSPDERALGVVTNAPHAPRSAWKRLTDATGARTPVSLVVPASWCALREAPIELREWTRSDGAIRELVDSTFPFSSADAFVSLVAIGAYTDQPRTLILGVARSRIEPWLDALRTHLGGQSVRVVPEAACLLGIGAQHHETCIVVDPSPAVGASMHRFERGSLMGVGEPLDSDEVEDVRAVGGHVLTIDRGTSQSISGDTIAADVFAAGAAMEPIAAPGHLSPFVGDRSRTPKPWLLPAGALAAAVALVATGWWYESARYRDAFDRVVAERASISSAVVDATAERDAALDARETIENELAPIVRAWRPILPTLREALDAVPAEGFAYRVRLDARRIEMSGEAPRAAEVLERLDASESFTSAEQTQPISTVPIRELETFAVRAERAEASQ